MVNSNKPKNNKKFSAKQKVKIKEVRSSHTHHKIGKTSKKIKKKEKRYFFLTNAMIAIPTIANASIIATPVPST